MPGVQRRHPSPTEDHPRDDLHVLRYDRPAAKWVEALPVGNGHRGAMCAGRPGTEHLWLNDGTAWSGTADQDPLAGVRARGAAHLDAVRAAVADGDVRSAERLLAQMQTPWTQAYLPLAETDVAVVAAASDVDTTGATGATGRADTRRHLDLRTAVATHWWSGPGTGDVVVETWADARGGAVVHTVRAERPVRLTVRVTSLLRPAVPDPAAPSGARASVPAPVTLLHRVELPVDVPPDHAPHSGGIRYDAARARTGTVAVRAVGDPAAVVSDGVLRTGAATDHVLLFATATTDPPGPAPAATAAERLRAQLDVASGPGGTVEVRERLRAAHVAEHRRLYDRAELVLPSPPGAAALTTDARVVAAERREDPGLAALAFHHGRYLLISSSRPGGLPATLQGLWNPWLPGPWSSAYTLNINLQMAYWAAESTGLAECHEPLLDQVRRTAAGPGAEVARELYGTRGWVAHHNADAWGHAAPVGAGVGDASWSAWSMGGLWLSQHLVEHARFCPDERSQVAALREAWPVLQGAALFTLDWVCTATDDDGVLHAWTSPSTSPENRFVAPDGRPAAVTVSATMDVFLVRRLADACREAAAELGLDVPWTAELARVAAALPDPRPGPRGELAEWAADLTEAEPEHRHLSHLVGLYPLGTVDPATTPHLAAAARRTLDLRGRESTGWSLAWRLALWARLGEGSRAHEQVLLALRPAADGLGHRGGLYPNLFSAHPPFQLDGSCGLTAGIAELLLRSRRDADGVVHLDVLPALPPAWPQGQVSGLRIPGGARVDVAWHDARITHLTLHGAGREVEVALRAGGPPPLPTAPGPGRGRAERDGSTRFRVGPGDILAIDPSILTPPHAGRHSPRS
ncbi:glycosyl hydrolase family 95 catalytic domain-containing protein [Isoptericola jiangsuensis]|uniref:glycosyl hydrolase family 95 catalytic domain-containing protein n=1 Tax=Isoptericola jiangsuensis TaxID=548579 RepID=UPI003AAEDF7F